MIYPGTYGVRDKKPGESPGRMLADIYATLTGELHRIAAESGGALALLDHEQRVVLLAPGFVELFDLEGSFEGQDFRSLLEACSGRMENPEGWREFFLSLFVDSPRRRVAAIGKTTDGQKVEFATDFLCDPEHGQPLGWVVSAVGEPWEKPAALEKENPGLIEMFGHELNLPLQGLLSSTDLLLRGPLDREQRRLVEDLQASGQILSDTVIGIRSLSPGGGVRLEEAFQVPDVFASLEKMFRTVQGRPRVVFQVHGDLFSERISDPRLIRHVLANLIDNALKYTEGKVWVEALVEDGADVQFSVRDQGPAIRDCDRARIFSAGISLGSKNGTGVGLHIAQEMVRRLGGGRICLRASEEGNSFSFRIPLLHVQPAAEDTKARILVVDDDPLSRRLLAEEVELLGFPAVEASSSADALHLWHEMEPGLALLDICMPGTGGVELASMMRENRPGRPLVSISGLPGEEDLFLGQGFDAHLAKPVTLDRLESTLVGLFSGPGAAFPRAA